MKEALGDHIIEKFIAAKKNEWNEFRKSVSEWEINKYLKTM